jgi:hypothetical protein
MNRANAIGRLGMLAVGLGIGAAVAATSGIAAADSTVVDPAAIDPSALIADPAPAASGLDVAISIDGSTLFQEGTATAYSGTDDIAIAYGSDAIATAGAGTGDYAFADGTDAQAYSGVGNEDSATAIGADSFAVAGTGNGDTALADGSGTGAIAGESNSGTVDVAGDDCYASAVGNDDFAYAGPDVGSVPSTTEVTGDIASVIGNSSEAISGAGNYDFAGALGEALTSSATGANFLFELMPSL